MFSNIGQQQLMNAVHTGILGLIFVLVVLVHWCILVEAHRAIPCCIRFSKIAMHLSHKAGRNRIDHGQHTALNIKQVWSEILADVGVINLKNTCVDMNNNHVVI